VLLLGLLLLLLLLLVVLVVLLVVFQLYACIAGYRISPVRLGHGLLGLHWEFLRLWAGFEQEIACLVFLCNGPTTKRISFCFMR
jgi:hypothetical protein